MLTLDEYKDIIKQISALLNDDETHMETLKKLQDAFEESIANKNATPPAPPANQAPETDWKAKFDELSERYRKRFFDGEPTETTPAPAEVHDEAVQHIDAATNTDVNTLFKEV